MADMTHEDIERIWNSFSHYVPDRQKSAAAVDFINTLIPVQYNKKSRPDKLDVGLTAQNVQAALKKSGVDPKEGTIVHEIDTGNKMRLAYLKLISPMIKAIQELSDKVDKLENEGKE